ncbi:MAG: phosphate ABC transporter permease subunit PstC [Solirubrobacterales bacterium]
MSTQAIAVKQPRTRAARQNRRAELLLGAAAACISVFVYAMLFFILVKAWPSFEANGLGWFGSGTNVDNQLQGIYDSATTSQAAAGYTYTFNAWPLIWATLVICGISTILSLVLSLFAAVFIVEFAPKRLNSILIPSVRLLAGVPSVVYALLGVVLVVPFINNNIVSAAQKESVAYVVTLSGYSVLAGVVVLTMMIAPIMISMFSDGLRSVPPLWKEGSMALGVSKWRTCWKISLRAARPAIVAGTILAAARAIGEAIMLAMVAGAAGWAPNPADGWLFWLEPARTLASVIITSADQLIAPPMQATLFSLAAVLLLVTMTLSLIGFAIKQPLKKYGIRS